MTLRWSPTMLTFPDFPEPLHREGYKTKDVFVLSFPKTIPSDFLNFSRKLAISFHKWGFKRRNGIRSSNAKGLLQLHWEQNFSLLDPCFNIISNI